LRSVSPKQFHPHRKAANTLKPTVINWHFLKQYRRAIFVNISMKRMSQWIVLLISLTVVFTSATSYRSPETAVYSVAVDSVPGEDLVSVAQAKAVIQEILDAIDEDVSFEVRAAKIPNAAAAMAKGKKYILYNPLFIAILYKATGSNRWAPISILAHEIGHHLLGHTLQRNGGSQPSLELEADEFSGFVLRRMGASLEDAQLAMRVASTRRATATHPGRYDRLESIANGWVKSDAQIARLQRPATTDAEVLDERFIAYDVHFNSDPGNVYHITVRNNLVKLAGNRLSVLGKLLATDSDSYPYALQAGSNLLLVSNRGSLVNTEGYKLGYLTPKK
jgi:hypothetical protein